MDYSDAGPSCKGKIVTRLELYNLMKNCEKKGIEEKLYFLEQHFLNTLKLSEGETKEFKHKFSHVKSQFKNKWLGAHKIEKDFLRKNNDWLKETFELPASTSSPSTKESLNTGRPHKGFEECSERSKRRKTQSLRERTATEELIFAAQMKLRAKGEVDASKVIKDIAVSSDYGSAYRKALKTSTNFESAKKIPPLAALSMIVEANLSRNQYEIVRKTNKKIYPCYTRLQNLKKDCYPDPAAYTITETQAEVNLQDLLDHTASRLALYLGDVLATLSEEEQINLQLLYKWGCDGSNQKQYNQKFENSDNSDANIFQTCLVPLQLCVDNNNKKIIWQNPTPSSPRYCRPVRIRFVHESNDITREEVEYVNHKIEDLQKTHIQAPNCPNLIIQHKLLFTMVDGKVCNAVTQTTSTMRCYICSLTSKDFNNLDLCKSKEVKAETLNFGLSILHARIRLFESLLHISYKLTLTEKKSQVRTQEDKNIVRERKQHIQNEFKSQMGLIVDVPKPGFGNSNDGNTSRRFFSNPEMSAEITGINLDLIYRFGVILEVISSGHKIDAKKFEDYTFETAKMYVNLYPWQPMTPTVHKILVHGHQVIENALLPIGQLSEEASEARNKHFRSYRENFSRKCSRIACNMDVINRLLLTSDPFLTGMRSTPRKTTRNFSQKAITMFLSAECESQTSSDSEDDCSD